MSIVGPIEQRLRARLNHGVGLLRVEVHALGGATARGIVDRLVREGVAVLDAGRYRLATHTPDPVKLAQLEAERLARFEERKVSAERAATEAAQRELQRRAKVAAEADARTVAAGLRAYGQAEQSLVAAERFAALRESRESGT